MNLFDVYPLYDITPVSAKGIYVYDEKGKEYLDLYGGHAVISIGHSHPVYVKSIQDQVSKLGFYSNAIQNPLQQELANKIGAASGLDDYNLFLCSSGAEANENALKVASFVTKKAEVIAFKNSFHGRTSAAVAATDNLKINAPINLQQKVTFIDLGDTDSVEKKLAEGNVCAVILEFIQGVGGLDESTPEFYNKVDALCKKYGTFLIADEVQSGYGRTGDFFAFQKYDVTPDIISMAKGMGNGFPIGGILIHPDVKADYGMLGTTFGGNHLACAAGIAVLDVIKDEQLIANATKVGEQIVAELKKIPQIKRIKGRGLMVGLEFDFPVKDLRAQLLLKYNIFTGSSSNPNLIRLLPPLCINFNEVKPLFKALKELLP
jgi:acetylornithine/N-succinyldiaminopimelate aminotransferase